MTGRVHVPLYITIYNTESTEHVFPIIIFARFDTKQFIKLAPVMKFIWFQY